MQPDCADVSQTYANQRAQNDKVVFSVFFSSYQYIFFPFLTSHFADEPSVDVAHVTSLSRW